MANASDYLEEQIYNHLFRAATFAKPATIAIALTSDVPSDSAYNELPNANGYARIQNASGDALWNAHGTEGPGDNAVEFAFPQASADWGMVSGVVFLDSGTYGAGNMLLQGALTTPRDVKSGDTFKFAIGDLDVTIA